MSGLLEQETLLTLLSVYPAVLMWAWYQLQVPAKVVMSDLSGCGTGAHNVVHKAWPILLQGTSPAQEDLPAQAWSAYVVCR